MKYPELFDLKTEPGKWPGTRNTMQTIGKDMWITKRTGKRSAGAPCSSGRKYDLLLIRHEYFLDAENADNAGFYCKNCIIRVSASTVIRLVVYVS